MVGCPLAGVSVVTGFIDLEPSIDDVLNVVAVVVARSTELGVSEDRT